MYLVALYLFILKLKLSTSNSLFPNHMDFQKVGETIFNNEKYNILKPTTHIISDYFEDFVLRRDNVNFPTTRVFLDDNGLRHYWSGFEKKTKSLRKTEILSDTIEAITNKANDEISETVNDTEMAISTNTNKNFKPSYGIDNTNSSTTDATDDISEAKDKLKKYNTTESSNIDTNSEGNDIKVHKHKKKEKSKDKFVSSNDIQLRGGAPTSKSDKERTVATTTFFCPYFGVVTMSAFID